MSLAPESRVMLTDALRPPAGHRVDVVVGTTYSLNLTSLLLAPLSFAAFDHAADEDLTRVDPIRLLEAVRRHAQHTTVFCQAGGIHVPSSYRSILTFVEDSVHEVTAPGQNAIFHPKIWCLRFIDEDGAHLHRVVVLSRNMTLDRSWDTALVLDEASDGAIDAAPAAGILRRMPGLATRPVGDARQAQVDDLATTLSGVRLAAPSPFTGGELLPIGLDGDVWPFPARARRLLAISPFLTRGALKALGQTCASRTLVSRAESLDLVGGRALDGWDVNVLQRLAEVEPSDDVPEAEASSTEFQKGSDGLHAKTFVLDLDGGTSMTVTGSANLTGSPWGRSVEFDAVLTGPTRACGVATVLDGSTEVPGLMALLEPYDPATEDGLKDPAIATSYELERFHRDLAVHLPRLHVSRLDGDRSEVSLSVTLPKDPPGDTRVWLASLSDTQAHALAATTTWTVATTNVTPFVVVETTAGHGDARVTRRCVLKADLTGDVDSRRHQAVFDVLKDKAAVLRYLVFLLGDPSYDALFAQLAGVGGERYAGGGVGSTTDVALFEPLVRAMGRDADALARVASLVEELRDLPGGEGLVPDGFDALWDVVWQVHREERR